jgi:zinc protease
MSVRWRCVAVLVALLAVAAGPATERAPADAAPSAAPRKVVTIEGITEYVLDNGFRVLLFPDPTKPTVTVNITYFVGSRHEGYGETGMAHLLEHMVFKGTPTHDDVWRALEDHGAFFNGTTWVDRTNYFETLPATPENLEFALALEADRMVHSKIASEDLAKEFSVVRNEFELGENYPVNVLQERMYSAAYLWHNYGKSTIGSRSDIERVPVGSLRAFYERYYQPDNAMLVVAGKFEPAQAVELIQRNFGPIPRPERKLTPTYTVEPVQDGERTVILRRTGDVGAVGILYHGVSGADDGFVAEEAIVDILTHEPAGRLYRALVEKGMASRVSGAAYPWAEPGVLQFLAEVRLDQPLEPVRDTMVELVEGLARGEIAQDELDRFKRRALKDIELAWADSQLIGIELSEWAALGDWRMIFVHRDRIENLTLDQVRRVAADFLKQSNRTVGLFIPTTDPVRTPLPGPVDVLAMVKDYKGRTAVSAGEEFVATIDNIESATVRATLANGMKLALLPKKTRGQSVEGQLVLHFGTEQDLKGRTTAATVVPRLLMRGTRQRSYQAIRDELDRLKAQVRLFSGEHGAAVVRLTTQRDTLAEVLALVAEMLREPSFPADQFEIVRRETLAELEQQLQDPTAQAFTALVRRINPWPKDDVRYVPSIEEMIERMRAVQLSEVERFHRELYGASDAELALVGDFDPAAVRAALESSLGGWRSPRPYRRVDTPYRAMPGSEELIQTPDKQMAVVGVAQAIEVRDDDPEYPALEMINYVLGSSAKSRLLERLRQKEGVSYGAFSSIQADPQDRNGFFFAGAICAPQNVPKGMEFLMDELRRLVKDGIPRAEIEDSKQSYKKIQDNLLADDRYVVATLASGLEHGRTFAFYAKRNDQIQKLTPEGIAAALNKHIRLEALVKVRAGDLKDQVLAEAGRP